MDGDYSSSSAAGNSHSCGGDDHCFLIFRYPEVGLSPVVFLGSPDNPCIIRLSYA